MAPPSEASILEQFLLVPAQLPAVVSLADFTALFPRSLQGSPHIRALYRDLQRQRNAVVDVVASDIDAEVARGRLLRRHALRARLQADAQEDVAGDDELQIEQFIGNANNNNNNNASGATGTQHNLITIVAELETVTQDLEAELQQLSDEEAQLRQTVSQTIDGLSDLRYGRLANPELPEQVIEGLKNVQATCQAASGQSAQTTI